MAPITTVPHSTEDRQWDVRINVKDDTYLETILQAIKSEKEKGKFSYILVGGLEIGTKPNHSDYQQRHVHVAAIFNNRCSKAAIIKNWGIIEGLGYYMVPRNRELQYSGWKAHHTKEFSKVESDSTKWILYEYGDLPLDNGKRKAVPLRSEAEKKQKTNDIIRDLRELIEAGKEEEAFQKYPRNYMQYGEKLKTMVFQKKKQFFGKHNNPHIYLYGFPGSGKTSLMKFVYPNYYKKDLQNRFFDLYNEEFHSHIMLEDLDSVALDKLGIQFLKTLCDEAGFTIDQKYKTPQVTRATILVTSNQTIDSLINCMDETKLVETTKTAISRRFLQLRVDQMQRLLGVKLISDYERKQLKKEGNDDPSKLYLDWNYDLDAPTGLPLKTPEQYQQMIRDYYYR
jgi:hypothetical protein